jgi:hypothetical protein
MSLYTNFTDMFLYTEFPELSPEEKDVLRAVVTHELYTSRLIRDELKARAQAVLDVLQHGHGASGNNPQTPPPQQP